MTDPLNRRIEFVDLTKGICIILVVMSHIGGAFDKLDSHSMIAAFRMPLYFFISGLFFKSYEGFRGFALRKINKLLIPFLFFYVGAFLLKYVVWLVAPGTFQQPVSWNELLLIFQGHSLIKFNPPIWFLVALFNCNILFYLVHYLRKRVGLMFFAILLTGATGFYLGKNQIVIPLYIDIAMTALPFYAGGFWIRRYNFFLFPHRLDKLIPVVVILSACILYFSSSSPGMRTNNYSGNIFQLYIAAFAGIFSIMLLCKKIKHIPVVSYLGRYSIITLSIHGPILHFSYPLATRFLHNEWLQAFGLLGLVLGISLITTPIFLKVIPQVVAQKNLIRITNCE
ncbi:MAG: acyltransferase [Bacteroides sp.]|nr:acyltransferase [Bacteroides sp.]MCD8081496.1 acyltransferase [Bacteroides sp.]